MRRSVLLVMLGFVAAVGCLNHAHRLVKMPTPPPRIDVEHWAESISDDYVLEWRLEIARRYPDAVIVICHGDDNEKGEWCFYPDKSINFGIGLVNTPLPPFTVVSGVAKLKAKYPGRTIVLMTCNPGHHRLTIPGVVYSLESVWLEPDRFQKSRSILHPEHVGNIFEFVEN